MGIRWRNKTLKRGILSVAVLTGLVVLWTYLKGDDDLQYFEYVGPKEYQRLIESKSSGKSNMAVVVPFRDRWEQLHAFLPKMQAYLAAQNIKHEFFIMNQVDEHRFNRAALINVGFLESRMSCDDMLIHDVDLVPASQKLQYHHVFPGPYHCIPPEVHPKYHYKKFVGGAMIFSDEQFKKIDGLTNKFWGWGGEDDEMFKRIKDHDMKIYRQSDLPPDISFVHLHSESKPGNRDDKFTFNQLIHMYRRDLRTGLHTQIYDKNGTKTYQVSGATVNIINVSLACDLHVSPWCYRLDQLSPEVLRRENKRNYFWYQALDLFSYLLTGTT